MDRTAAQAFRVVCIVGISLVIIVAGLIFAIASLCGLWSSSSTTDQGVKLVLGVGCPVIFIGGIFLIAKLAKGFARSRRLAAVAVGDSVGGATPEARDLATEEESLLHLRIAVGARILLSAAIVTYHQVQPNTY